MRNANSRLSTREYLRLIGVAELPPLTSPFDDDYTHGFALASELQVPLIIF